MPDLSQMPRHYEVTTRCYRQWASGPLEAGTIIRRVEEGEEAGDLPEGWVALPYLRIRPMIGLEWVVPRIDLDHTYGQTEGGASGYEAKPGGWYEFAGGVKVHGKRALADELERRGET